MFVRNWFKIKFGSGVITNKTNKDNDQIIGKVTYMYTYIVILIMC